MNKSILIFCYIFLWNLSYSQNFVPGETYFDSTGYVEYRAGNLPFIISAPHGGSLEPSDIPDRTCTNCVTQKDLWTKPIAEGMYDALFEITGCYPHLVVNLLHRKKFDANREIGEAADGNTTVEQSWNGYHEFIDAAKSQITSDYGRGLFLDIHGHAHTIQRIELGYLLSRAELQLTDEMLDSNTFIEESSIRTLVSDNVQSHTHSTLLRGQNSFGTLLDNKGFPSVPSWSDPFPQGAEPYFNGGYNTQRHGSKDNETEIDAIQIELNQDIRFDDSTRELLIDSLVQSAIEYYDFYYNDQFNNNFCNLIVGTSGQNIDHYQISLFPNPATNYFVVTGGSELLDVTIYNTVGQKMISTKVSSEQKIDIHELNSGMYIVQIRNETDLFQSKKIIVE